MKNENRFAEWLGLQTPLDIDNAKTLGRVLGWILVALGIISALFFVGLLALMGSAIFSSTSADDTIRNIALALAALVGLPFLVWRSIVAQQQVDVAQQGQITDRLNKAVEGLGAVKFADENGRRQPDLSGQTNEEYTAPNIEVRLGSIYSLKRIAKDSPEDHFEIIEILCAYIRENAPARSLSPSKPFKPAKPRTDVQAAINVLAARAAANVDEEHAQKFRLDLQGTDLSGVEFKEGDFSGAIFRNCRIEGGKFKNCNLAGARFDGSLLNYSQLSNCSLTGASWRSVTFNKGNILPLFDCEIVGLNVGDADIAAIRITSDFVNKPIFGTKKTALTPHNARQLSSALELKNKLQYAEMDNEPIETIDQLRVELNKSPFRFWSEFGFNDLATWGDLGEFHQYLGLTGWPYDDD